MQHKAWVWMGIFLVSVTWLRAQVLPAKFIAYHHKQLQYEGRVGITDSCAEFYWTGSNVTINISGATTVAAVLSSNAGNNYYYVIVDGDAARAKKIKIGKDKKSYVLADQLTGDKHRVCLFKVTNTDGNTTRLFGFEMSPGAKLQKPPKPSKRKIEFIGNSITCGHGVEDKSKDSGAPEFFNNYRAYGAITARYFNAQYHCTAKSGIGITISWFPEIMPEIFDRLDPNKEGSQWDFKKYQPQIVVINLFQNDSWLVNTPDHAQFKERFGTAKPTEAFIINAYTDFLKSVRNRYPAAQIICSLGNMDATREGSQWPGYINSAINSLQDKKMVAHFFAYKNSSGHPVIKEQQAMADSLVEFIKQQGYWK